MSFQHKNFKRNMLSIGIVAALTHYAGGALAQEDSAGESASQVEEEVIVRGIRASVMQSIDIKRNAGSVVDSITATDIGKLPDATIADSLQRITGIQITRSGGEGAIVNIRGNGNVSTTLNGEQMLAAGSITTITPDFADIPSTMVSGLDVYKSSEAKHLVSGLAGTINLKTNRPFLLDDGLTAMGKVEATQGSLGDEVDGAFSGFVGYNLDDEFGVMLNVSKSTSYLADYNNGSQGAEAGQYGGWSFNATEASNFVADDIDVNGDGDTNDIFYAFQGHQAGNRFIDRDRTGVNGSLQFRITDALELTGDVFYTKLDEHQYFAGIVASQAWQGETGWFTPDEGGVTAYPNISSDSDGVYSLNEGNYYTVQSAMLQARAVKTHTQTWAINKEALNTNLQLAFDNGGDFTAVVRWVHGEGSNDSARSIVDSFITSGSQIGDQYVPVTGDPINANPWGYDGVPATLPDGTEVADSYTQIPIHISYANGKQNWGFPTLSVEDGVGGTTEEVFGSNLNRYSAKSTNDYGEFTNANIDVLRVDGHYDLDFDKMGKFDMITSVDVGLRYGSREVDKKGWIGAVARTNQYGDAFVARWKDSATSAPETGESYIEPISFAELDELGMITGIDDFYGTTGLGTLYFIDPKAMDDPIAWHEQIYGTNLLVPDAANVYNVKEDTTSFYVQANLEGEIADMPYQANVGFKYVNTEFDVDQSVSLQGGAAEFNGQTYLIGPGVLQPVGDIVNTTNSYGDFLPAVNFALDVTDDQVVRASFTKTVSTHNTDMLGGGLTVNRTANCDLRDSTNARIFCANSGSQEGNPLLEPNRNTNAEVSYEWYISDNSMLNVGLFWVQQNTNIVNVEVLRDDITDSDGVVRGFDLESGEFTGFTRIQTNEAVSDKSYTRGLEAGYRQSFDFLDGFMGGFGIDANVTYSPSTSTYTDFYGEDLPAIGNSEYQTNLALWYEDHGIQARIAHNYRSKMFVSRKREGLYNFAYFASPTNYIDASISYDINDDMTVSLQGTNLTEEYIETYHQWESNVDGRFYNERRLTLGFQAKF